MVNILKQIKHNVLVTIICTRTVRLNINIVMSSLKTYWHDQTLATPKLPSLAFDFIVPFWTSWKWRAQTMLGCERHVVGDLVNPSINTVAFPQIYYWKVLKTNGRKPPQLGSRAGSRTIASSEHEGIPGGIPAPFLEIPRNLDELSVGI